MELTGNLRYLTCGASRNSVMDLENEWIWDSWSLKHQENEFTPGRNKVDGLREVTLAGGLYRKERCTTSGWPTSEKQIPIIDFTDIETCNSEKPTLRLGVSDENFARRLEDVCSTNCVLVWGTSTLLIYTSCL